MERVLRGAGFDGQSLVELLRKFFVIPIHGSIGIHLVMMQFTVDPVFDNNYRTKAWWLIWIGVRKDYHRHGIGSALIARAREEVSGTSTCDCQL